MNTRVSKMEVMRAGTEPYHANPEAVHLCVVPKCSALYAKGYISESPNIENSKKPKKDVTIL
jgi:hypothetical protein